MFDGVSVTCTPLHFGTGKTYSKISAHPLYAVFLQQSTKDDTDPSGLNIYFRFDIHGNSDDEPATTAKEEEHSRAWMFRARFDSSLHDQRLPVLAHEGLELENDSDEMLLNHFRNLLEPMSDDLDLLSCSLSQHCSSLSLVNVTGVLKSKVVKRL